jgi:ribonuclease VapC
MKAVAATKAEFALDSSAVMAILQAEKGHEFVAERMGLSVISSVNYAEVVASLVNNGMPYPKAAHLLNMISLEVIPFDVDQAQQCGALRPATKQYGLSLGDRACLALAQRYGLTALTSDQNWQKIQIGVQIHFLR